MEIVPLGDQAAIVVLPDESAAVLFSAAVREAAPDWLHDVVPAYSRVGIYFDADRIRFADVAEWLTALPIPEPDSSSNGRRFHIPVCYELGPDLDRVSKLLALPIDEVIRWHTGTEYTVHAIGFVPGFPYMGYLPEPLCGVGRLASPRLQVEPGSVGVTGRQTAIYPLPRPGGWHLIGRTPLTLVDVADGFFPLQVGDRVRFERIDEAEYQRRNGDRLEASESVAIAKQCTENDQPE